MLGVFHLSEKFHQAGRALLGEGEAARARAQERLDRLIAQGARRALAALEAEAQAAGPEAVAGAGGAAAWETLLGYLREHRHAMDYAGRLARGQPIGSGLVAGACKNMLGRRLKLNSARWRPENAEAVAALCCVDYNQQWHECFDAAA